MASQRRAGCSVHVRRLGVPPRPTPLPGVLRVDDQETNVNRPLIVWSYDIPLRRHVAYCPSCEWTVADSSMTVVYRAAQVHRTRHETTR